MLSKTCIPLAAAVALGGGFLAAPAATADTSTAAITVQADTTATSTAAPRCKIWEENATRFSGWCDGQGPASYRATITCRRGGEHQGQWRWLGDRRGSTAWCERNDRVASKFQFRTG